MNLLRLLKAREPASADLRRELEAIDIAGRVEAADTIRAQRRAMLLDGEVGSALDAIERDLIDAERERDRAVALDEELRSRIAEADQREKIDALMKRKVQAERGARETTRAYEERLPMLIAELIALRDARRAAFNEAIQCNHALEASGTTDRVSDPGPKLDASCRHADSVIALL